ncbi:hypothetical protein [Marinobacter alexandrii]|uniref:hypothetical protein n=1 Tax=Marinobacter alexandrii TaxID=2570351 RepID=UPI001109D31F|nr:hypothetical protein [Marinobacter alexandrii]
MWFSTEGVQRIDNPRVGGSIPPPGTKIPQQSPPCAGFVILCVSLGQEGNTHLLLSQFSSALAQLSSKKKAGFMPE